MSMKTLSTGFGERTTSRQASLNTPATARQKRQLRRVAGKNDSVLWTVGLVLVGIAAWAVVRRAAVDRTLRVWWTAVVLLIAGFASVGLAFVEDGDASFGFFYLGALLIGLSAAIGIPASFAAWRQRDAPIWPPR
jgi:hypothetical protein